MARPAGFGRSSLHTFSQGPDVVLVQYVNDPSNHLPHSTPAPGSSAPIIGRRRLLLVCTTLTAIAFSFLGCDDAPTTDASDDDATDQGASLQLVVPSHETTPAVELTFQLTSIDDDEADALREPVGNIIYLAIRDCAEAHPDEDSDQIGAAALNFRLRNGKVVDVEKRDAKLRQDRATHVSDAGYSCLLDQVGAQSPELPNPWKNEDFDVVSQVEMYW